MTNLERYIIARYMYSIGEDFLTDSEYRVLEDTIKEEDPSNIYLNRSWSDDPCPKELLIKYNMSQYIKDVVLLHKSDSITSLNNEQLVENMYKDLNERTELSFKLDGFHIQHNYYNGEYVNSNTRGRKTNSLDVTKTMKQIVPGRIPLMGRVRIKGEAIIPNSKWKMYSLKTGNTSQRNSVSTALANEDVNVLEFVAFAIESDSDIQTDDMFKLLNEIGFKTPYRMFASNYSSLMRMVTMMSKRSLVYDYPTDGLVAKNSKGLIAIRIGAWLEETLNSYVTGYIEETGIHGKSLLISIYPTLVDGRTISKITTTNIAYIVEGNLRIGSPVAFDIRSSAIGVHNSEATRLLQNRTNNNHEFMNMVIERERAKQDS